jgi:hypothetical protein
VDPEDALESRLEPSHVPSIILDSSAPETDTADCRRRPHPCSTENAENISTTNHDHTDAAVDAKSYSGVDMAEKCSEDDDDDDESRKKRIKDEIMRRHIPIGKQIRAVMLPQWITVNWLLLASPPGIVLYAIGVSPVATFILNFLPIIPCTSIITFAADDLMIRLGPLLGGVLFTTVSFVMSAILPHIFHSTNILILGMPHS